MNFNYDNYPFKTTSSIEQLVYLYKDSYKGSMWDLYYGNASSDNYYGSQAIEYSYEYNISDHTYDLTSFPFQANPGWGQGFNDTINVLRNGGTPVSTPNGSTYADIYWSGNKDLDTWLDGENLKLGIVFFAYDDFGNQTSVGEYKDIDCSITYEPMPTPTPTPTPTQTPLNYGSLSDWLTFNSRFAVNCNANSYTGY